MHGEFDAVRGVHQAVQDGIGDGRLSDELVPHGDGDLGGHDGALDTHPILKDLVEKQAALVVQGLQAEVVEDEQILLGDALEFLHMGVVHFGDLEVGEELPGVVVGHLVAMVARLIAEGGGEIALAGPRGAGDDDRITSYNVCYTKLLRWARRILHVNVR